MEPGSDEEKAADLRRREEAKRIARETLEEDRRALEKNLESGRQ